MSFNRRALRRLIYAVTTRFKRNFGTKSLRRGVRKRVTRRMRVTTLTINRHISI
jgi:hypothetical protein